jgi:antibiotic biosynthesis monooxygenase (ABM) superfamily enzyme
MTNQNDNHPTQHIGGTIMVVMMDVEPEHEEEFNRWYNDEHLVERLEIPGYVSARRFKLEEGRGGVLKYLCIWELDDSSPLTSEEYKAQRLRPSELRDRVNTYITQRSRGVYKQIYPPEGSYEDHSGFHPERVNQR